MIEVIYKESVAEHTTFSALSLYMSGHIIGAHILASAAFEIMEEVVNDAAKFSATGSFWKALEEIFKEKNGEDEFNKRRAKNGKFRPYAREVRSAYNFFKHADSDMDKEIDFDPSLTKHILFISIVDLMRLQRIRPKKGEYEVCVRDELIAWMESYKADHRKLDNNLSDLSSIIFDGLDNENRKYVDIVKKWLVESTDLLKTQDQN